ncbi:hypothetical protein O181_019091 [Austropuccinia psidii MF-1]|uniref:SP-RING-type domain-containing protein n=1 Tax=Austropuccinia psidii MF-1 TaxID=1389203 RepID=A0A9Q3CAU7_9BASI|nr:hypothetical protein [Austropuccinia psidii MF-1]
MSSLNLYQDFSKLRATLPTLRVDQLKIVLRDINQKLRVSARLTGRKDELIHRIESYLQDAISSKSTKNYEQIRAAIHEHSHDTYIPAQHYTPHRIIQHQAPPILAPSLRAAAPTVDFGSVSLSHLSVNEPFRPKADPVFATTSTPSMIRPPLYSPNHPPSTSTHNLNPSSNSNLFPSYPSKSNPIHPPPFPATYVHPAHPSARETSLIPIPFESSSFYRIDSAASVMGVCHRAVQNDRKSVPLTINLLPEQREKLLKSSNDSSGSHFQLRLFSTSEVFFNHPAYTPPMTPVLPPAPIEFPTTIDIKLNGFTLTANVRGIKKQPGTAPPPNLGLVPGRNGVGTALDLRQGSHNRLEIAYSNSDKRFFCIVYLVEYFGVPQLMKSLKAARRRSEEQVLQEILAASADDDVIMSASAVSLTDPVVFSRIKTPIRSSKCNHLQCFDAEMFYMMMEQTPTWLCPVCNTKIKSLDIAIDEYFEAILRAVPDSVDSVVIEADGTWHDEKYKHGTNLTKPDGSVCSVASSNGVVEDVRREKKRKITILELESEEENEFQRFSKRPKGFEGSPAIVIDLTLDDD